MCTAAILLVEMYKKLDTNMPELNLLTESDKGESPCAKGLGEIAAKHGCFSRPAAQTRLSPLNAASHPSGLYDPGHDWQCQRPAYFPPAEAQGNASGLPTCIESRVLARMTPAINGSKSAMANKRTKPRKKSFETIHITTRFPAAVGTFEETDTVHMERKKLSLDIGKTVEQQSFCDQGWRKWISNEVINKRVTSRRMDGAGNGRFQSHPMRNHTKLALKAPPHMGSINEALAFHLLHTKDKK
jgi:hypothetical protein